MTRPIGIDLGTTYTVVATIEGGRPRIIPTACGQRLTPSVVCFTPEGQALVGLPTGHPAMANPQTRTIASIKRWMGSDYRVRASGRDYTPQEISSLILRQVKRDAEDHLGEPVDKAVITVPAYFNDRQRQATRQAAILAGLEVLGLLSEPAATALAYGLGREEVHTVLVWDLGGGTFDVSILELGEGLFEVKAVSGDTQLGGDDYDQRLADYLAEECRQTLGIAYPTEDRARQRLQQEAQRAKVSLSTSPLTTARIPLPGQPPEASPLEIELTRELMEDLTADLLQRMVGPARQALKDAGLKPTDIDRIVLAGGATRMPAVRQLVRQMFEKEPYRYLDPDEVVALGAAIQAGMLLGVVGKAVLLDVIPLSLGLETQGGLVARLLPRNTPLPATVSQIFTTAADYQTSMYIHVLQGERALASENISLGHFLLDGILPAPKGVPKVEVSLEADIDGIVHVSAQDLLTSQEVKARLVSSKHLDPQEIEDLVGEAREGGPQLAEVPL